MNDAPAAPVPYPIALARGASGRCPSCGKGKLFAKFLKVAPACSECGQAYHHHRADDLPAYLVILVLGHILVPLVVWVEMTYSPPYWVHLLVWTPLGFAMAIGMLQPIKGAVVALQWRMGMHGFHRR